jgi:hypothetical protein
MVWRPISAIVASTRSVNARSAAACIVLAWLGSAVVAPLVAQRGRTAPQANVPPVSMTCPMHPDVVESSPGDCPICKMKLVPVRLETVWTCPVHPLTVESKPGKCPIDHRDLIQMTVALTWACQDHPEIDHIDRGRCPDGSLMVAKRTLRPHGNHNPQHGGQFFMAPDNFHHLEGAYPRARVFRVYLYDDYARPLPAAQLKQVKARVVTRESRDAATQVTNEIAVFPLVARNGSYLEARIDAAAFPAQVSAKVQFKRDAPEYRFDFTFPAFTKDAVLPSPAPQKAAGSLAPVTPEAKETPDLVSREPAPAPAQPPVDPSLVSLPIPDTVGGIVVQLMTRSDQVGELIRRGDFTAVYVPAFQARDLAIALESHLGELAAAKREAAEPAITRLVRTAWLLDAFGDLGNRQQITDAYAIFTSTVADVVAAFK